MNHTKIPSATVRSRLGSSLLLRSLTMAAIGTLAAVPVQASSHREAPLITSTPKLDGTDFYMFNSYETGRSNFVTIVANYIPDQSPAGGPNFFMLDPDALYEIHVDNNGDAIEDVTFQFRITNIFKKISLPIGPPGNQRTNPVPVVNVGPFSESNRGALNVIEQYSLNIIRGNRRTGVSQPVTTGGSNVFLKPFDNIGNKSITNYNAYADAHIYTIDIPGCATPGKVFVGQRKDPFVVNLGEAFDLINLNPIGPITGGQDALRMKNVTSFILEIPKDCLVSADTNNGAVIGAWTTASKITAQGTNQLSRLGAPLVNELVFGLGDTVIPGVLDKDAFNTTMPAVPGDAVLINYVTHPTFPAIVELLFSSAGVTAPTNFPRTDLITVFLTGIAGLNQTTTAAEYLRLNTTTPAIAADQQNNLGVIAGDLSGYPNGRRPGDDVVDITLRVAMGKLLSTNDAPSGQLPYTDGAFVNASMFATNFPYIRPPLPGSPNDFSVLINLQASSDPGGPFTNVLAIYDEKAQKLITPKTDNVARFFRLQSDTPTGNPVTLDSRRIETTPNVQLGITR
ncbi:MAG: DUF4331 domain-containing protein [Akkermansiaceae bacterium]|nr:DUF4331 domain-containing protein [Verrucomicrobiales bacterium]